MKARHTLLAALGLASLATAQDGFTPVPESVLETVASILPESSSADAAFTSPAFSPNVIVSEPASLEVVFVWEGTGFRDSLGYFTYQIEPDGAVTILSRGLLIPDASFPGAGSAVTGDTYTLRDDAGAVRVFEAGTRIGFFVVAHGWIQEPQIQDWDPATATVPSNDPDVNASFARGCYTSLSPINPEYAEGAAEKARHLAMVWMPGEPGFLGGQPYLLGGFEDRSRTGSSDEDFNDLVFVITANPIQAIAGTNATTYQNGDPDGDGAFGLDDSFPDDPERAYVLRSPSQGFHVLGFEDQYPGLGDADYNDVVLAYEAQVVHAADGTVKDLLLTSHLVGRGAGYDHRIGWHIPGLPEDAAGTVEVQRFLSDDAGTVETPAPMALRSIVQEHDRRLPDLFHSTSAALPPGFSSSTFTNTQFDFVDRLAASSRTRVTFEERVSPEVLGTLPYDLYVSIRHGDEEWDVHTPGYPGFPDRPDHLPPETDALSFLDDIGRPWLLELPTSWRFPMEHIRIWNGYPLFDAWAASGGTSYTDWYDHPSPEAGLLSFEISAYVPVRDWSFGLPTP